MARVLSYLGAELPAKQGNEGDATYPVDIYVRVYRRVKRVAG